MWFRTKPVHAMPVDSTTLHHPLSPQRLTFRPLCAFGVQCLLMFPACFCLGTMLALCLLSWLLMQLIMRYRSFPEGTCTFAERLTPLSTSRSLSLWLLLSFRGCSGYEDNLIGLSWYSHSDSQSLQQPLCVLNPRAFSLWMHPNASLSNVGMPHLIS